MDNITNNKEKYYLVRIVETSSKTVKIKASSLEDAKEKAEKAYEECKIIIDADDFDEYEIYPMEMEEDESSYYDEV